MKRKTVVIVIALLLLLSTFTQSTFAYSQVQLSNAVTLKSLGLFFGDSNSNFDLDRTPTRVETLVMLIRIMGLEETVEDNYGEGNHPFVDVPEWAYSYVNYAYEKKLAKGISATELGAKNPSNAKTYLTFMLRALGYSDKNNIDFTYENPFELANRIGLTNLKSEPKNFTRGDLVDISINALRAKIKGSQKSLIGQLYDSKYINVSQILYTDFEDVVFEKGKLPGNIVKVSNGTEFLKAIKSDTIIELSAGEYNISRLDISKIKNKNVVFNSLGKNEYEVVIKDVKNLSIVGNDKSNTFILSEPRYANVLKFENAENLALVNLTMGHTDKEGYCTGGVLYFDKGENIYLSKLDLYGCGTYGIEAMGSNYIDVKNTKIHDCTYGGINLSGNVYGFTFADSEITNSKEFSAIDVYKSTGILITGSKISGNNLDNLVNISDSVDFRMTSCNLKGNKIGKFLFSINDSDNIIVEETSLDKKESEVSNTSLNVVINNLTY